MDQFNFSYFPYTNFNETNLDWIMEHITACGNFWTASQSSLVMDPDHGTGVSFYLNDMTGRPGVPEPQLGDAVFYSEEGITYVAFIDDVVGGGGSNPEFISFRRYRLTGPQGDPGTPGGGGTGLTEEIKQALLQLARKVAYIDADGEDYYQDLYDALYSVEPPATLVSIDAVYTQSGTVYDTDNLYSLEEDLVVTAYYSDGTSAVIPAQDYTLSGTLAVGTSTITVSYGGMTDTFSVTVTENPVPPATLVSIDAVYAQSGTVYNTDSLDRLKADLAVTATYSDSTTAVVPAADYTLSGTLTVGSSVITVSYEGKTDSFTVTVIQMYVTDGLIMWLDGERNGVSGAHETTLTTWVDQTGNQWDWTNFGATVNPKSVVFDDGDHLDRDYQSLPATVQMMEVVFSSPHTGAGTILTGFGDTVPGNFLMTSGDLVRFHTGNTSAQNTNIPETEWNTVHTYNSAGYRDGVAVTTTTSTSSWQWLYPCIGHYRGHYGTETGYQFTGEIFAIRLYSRILTEAEILQNAATDVARFGIGE